MRVKAFKRFNTAPILFPVPNFDDKIISTRDDDAFTGMHGQASDVIVMRLKLGHSLLRIVIKNTNGQVVRATNDPVLAYDKFRSSNWGACNIKRFDDALGTK